MDIKTVGVVGSGQMGKNIALLFAQKGFTVLICNLNDSILANAVADIAKRLEKNVVKGIITAAMKKETLQNITTTTELMDLGKSDFVIEAIVENLSVKLDLFEQLDEICHQDVIITTNTGSFTISKIASATKRPDKIMGMHFMNPVQLMALIELVKGSKTSDDTFKIVHELAIKLGKTPITVNDSPGFVTNRILQAMINESIYCLHEGLATKAEIDEIMKLGMNHPIGPLALADLIGLDTVLYMLEYMYDTFGNIKYRPCPLLKEYVKSGYLGRKSGKGFYEYPNGHKV